MKKTNRFVSNENVSTERNLITLKKFTLKLESLAAEAWMVKMLLVFLFCNVYSIYLLSIQKQRWGSSGYL